MLTYSLLPGGSRLSAKGTRTKAGVLIAVARRHASHNSLARPEVPAHLEGWVSHVRLAPPGRRPLEFIAAYMPTAAEDQETRRWTEDYILQAERRCRRAGTTLLTGGDWNATLRDADRSTGNAGTADERHRAMVAAAQLEPAGGQPASPEEPREPTYRQHAASGDDGV